jgi:hypothetical protein
MEYSFLRTPTQMFAEQRLANLEIATKQTNKTFVDELSLRVVDTGKLSFCSLADSIVHAATGFGKIAIAVIQLPLQPLLGGVTARVALSDAGEHFVGAGKSLFAALVVLLPASVSPGFALTTYRWLTLAQASKENIFLTLASRVSSLIKTATATRERTMLFAAVTATVVSYWYFGGDDQIPTNIATSIALCVGVLALAGIAYRCCRKSTIKAPDREAPPPAGREAPPPAGRKDAPPPDGEDAPPNDRKDAPRTDGKEELIWVYDSTKGAKPAE